MEIQLRRASESNAASIKESWGSLCWLASKKVGNAAGITIGRVVIRKGESNPRHSHSGAEEVLYLLQGRLRHTVGDKDVVMEAGDTLVLGPDIFHNATSIGDEDADMIVAYPTGVRDFKLE